MAEALDAAGTYAYAVGSLSVSGSEKRDVAGRARRALTWWRDVVTHYGVVLPFALVQDVGFLLLEGWHFPFLRPTRQDEVDRIGSAVRTAYANSFLGVLLRDDSFRRAIEAVATDPSRDDLIARAILLAVRGVRVDVELNPSVVRGLRLAGRLDPDAEAAKWSELAGVPIDPATGERRPSAHVRELESILERLISRVASAVYAADDLSEIIHWSAYRKAAQRLAGRKIARFVGEIAPFDRRKIRTVAETGPETDVQDTGTWAEGGYVGITTRGSVESIVPSELAYMGEESGIPGVDLFGYRHAQNELLFYERDQSQLQKIRRIVRVVFAPDSGFRVKAPGHSDSLEVGIYGTIVKLAADLEETFAEDVVTVVVHVVDSGSKQRAAEDAALLSVLMSRQVSRGTVQVHVEPASFAVAALPDDRKFPDEARARVYWVGFAFLDAPPVGVPVAVEPPKTGKPPRVVVAKVGGARPTSGRVRGAPVIIHLPLERSDDDVETIPLELVTSDARDEILVEVASTA